MSTKSADQLIFTIKQCFVRYSATSPQPKMPSMLMQFEPSLYLSISAKSRSRSNQISLSLNPG